MRLYYLGAIVLLAAAPSSGQQVAVPGNQPVEQSGRPVNDLPQQSAPAGISMHLICRGTGERTVQHATTGFAFSGGQTATFFGGRADQSQFGEQLDIDIQNGVAKVRVPRRFLPRLHGGDGGWFDVSKLEVGPDEITGKVDVNFAQHPNLRIDRRSGSVALDGKVGSFAGQCEKFDPSQRAF